jgi:hypothetical protein
MSNVQRARQSFLPDTKLVTNASTKLLAVAIAETLAATW